MAIIIVNFSFISPNSISLKKTISSFEDINTMLQRDNKNYWYGVSIISKKPNIDNIQEVARNQAIAEIDVRLVKESDPHRLIKLIKNHIIKQGAYVIENRDPTEEERLENSNIIRFDSKVSYLAFRTEINSPIGNWASSALKKAFGRTPIKIRTSGGSIPISPFVTILDVPALTYPSVNKDNNQHSPNENIKIGNFIDGTLGMVYLLLEKIN